MASTVSTFMLDTNVFSRVLDGLIPTPSKSGRRLLVLGVQADECHRTPCPVRRAALLRVIDEIAPEVALASSFCFDVEGAGLDQAEWNDGTGMFEAMLSRLRTLDRKQKTPAQQLNQIRDIVIAETALKRGATLVSDDAKLRQVVAEFGGSAIPSSAL